MAAFRFMIPLIPLLAVAISRGVSEAGGFGEVRLAAVASLALAVISATQIVSFRLNPGNMEGAALVGAQVGVYMDRHWAPGSVVGINVAGSTAYFADRLNFIDMLGLNDSEIAKRTSLPENDHILRIIGHRKGDGASVLARRPDYIVASAPSGVVLRPDDDRDFLGDYELAHSSEFSALYKPCEVMIPASKAVSAEQIAASFAIYFVYYQRRDLEAPCWPAA